MNERIKELDEQLKNRKLMVVASTPANSGIQWVIDHETLRLMELRSRIELAQQIEQLCRAVRDVQGIIRAKF